MIILMIEIMIIRIIIILMLLLLLSLLLLLLIRRIIKDAWANFDSQIYCTLFADNDLKQTTKEHK